MITLVKTRFKNVRVFTSNFIDDYRGRNIELFNKKTISEILPEPIEFIRDSCSYSQYSVLRGFHGDYKTWKLVRCLKGTVFSIIIDLDKNSETYLEYEKFTLSEFNNRQILLPPAFVNAHLCMSDNCLFNYKMSTYHEDTEQITVKYNSFGIKWPIENIILSDRDKYGPFIELK